MVRVAAAAGVAGACAQQEVKTSAIATHTICCSTTTTKALERDLGYRLLGTGWSYPAADWR